LNPRIEPLSRPVNGGLIFKNDEFLRVYVFGASIMIKNR